MIIALHCVGEFKMVYDLLITLATVAFVTHYCHISDY